MAGLLCQILGATIGLQLLALFNTGCGGERWPLLLFGWRWRRPWSHRVHYPLLFILPSKLPSLHLPKLHVLGSLLGFGISLEDILGFRQLPSWPQWPSIYLFSHLWKMVPFRCGLGWASSVLKIYILTVPPSHVHWFKFILDCIKLEKIRHTINGSIDKFCKKKNGVLFLLLYARSLQFSSYWISPSILTVFHPELYLFSVDTVWSEWDYCGPWWAGFIRLGGCGRLVITVFFFSFSFFVCVCAFPVFCLRFCIALYLLFSCTCNLWLKQSMQFIVLKKFNKQSC